MAQTGSWTPTLGDGTNNYTLATAYGSYSKSGDIVQAFFNCTWTSIGAAGAGALRIDGLPFLSNGAANGLYAASFCTIEGIDTTATANQITGQLGQASTAIFLRRVNDNAGMTSVAANTSSATGIIAGSITYKV